MKDDDALLDIRPRIPPPLQSYLVGVIVRDQLDSLKKEFCTMLSPTCLFLP